MKKHGLWLLLFAMTIALLMFPAAATVLAQHHGGASHHGSSAQHHPGDTQHHAGAAQTPQIQALKVGKKGEMTFSAETQVGDMTLRPGRYTFQHRVDGSEHFVHFTQVGKVRGGREIPATAHPGEIKCRLEPLASKADSTEVYTVKEEGAARITKIIVRGENVAHVF